MTIRKIKGLILSIYGCLLNIFAISRIIESVGNLIGSDILSNIQKDIYTLIVWGIIFVLSIAVIGFGVSYTSDGIIALKRDYKKNGTFGVNCPVCKAINSKDSQTCTMCGAMLKAKDEADLIENTTWTCPECGKENNFPEDRCVCGAVRPWRK